MRLYLARPFGCLFQFISSSPEQTQALGAWIGAKLPQASVVGLDGSLGAGKTCMVQGIVRGLGSPKGTLIVSPAYNLVQEYNTGTRNFVHIDFYRLDQLSVSDTLLFTEIFERPDTVMLVEWASKFLHSLVPGFLSIKLSYGPSFSARCIQVTGVGEASAYSTLLASLPYYEHPPD